MEDHKSEGIEENTQQKGPYEGLQETPFEVLCSNYRSDIKDIGECVKELLIHGELVGEQSEEGQLRDDEMEANIMLAYRHLEDARMRVGKILQAKNGGVSILDK